jgi:hypothetical protein
MIISHKHKFIFFRPNGKNGGSSIEDALKEYHDGPAYFLESNNTNLMHISPRIFFSEQDNQTYKDYYKFAVVRNPYDWYLALHRWAIRDKSDINAYKEKVDKYYIPTQFKWDSPENSFDIQRVNETLTVISMVNYLYDNQFCCLCYRGELMADTVLKFENLQKDFDSLMQYIGLTAKKLKHIRKKVDYGKWKSYRYYYSNDAMKVIEQTCDFDFNAFGYKKESE